MQFPQTRTRAYSRCTLLSRGPYSSLALAIQRKTCQPSTLLLRKFRITYEGLCSLPPDETSSWDSRGFYYRHADIQPSMMYAFRRHVPLRRKSIVRIVCNVFATNATEFPFRGYFIRTALTNLYRNRPEILHSQQDNVTACPPIIPVIQIHVNASACPRERRR